MNKEQVKEIIRAWILRMNESETLPPNITALNFGLNEPYAIELIGAIFYDEEDSDWACEEDFKPTERNCDPLNINEEENWEKVLKTIVVILKELVDELPNVPILKVKHITTGFCDGDLEIVK